MGRRVAAGSPRDPRHPATAFRPSRPALIPSGGFWSLLLGRLGQDPDEGEGGKGGKEENEQGSLGHELTFSILGAILIGSSVAPTEEIIMVAVQSPTWAVLALAVLTFVIALGIVAYVGFKGSGDDTIFAGGAFGDACVTYAVALLVAAALLWSAGRLDGIGFGAALHYTVYLALPCALGSSAGRMLL